MSLSKSNCWCSNNCINFLKHAVPSLTSARTFYELTLDENDAVS